MNNEEFDFDKEFTTDDEVDEMLDSIVMSAAKQAEIEDNRTQIINPNRVHQVIYTYRVLKYLTKGSKGVKVTYKLHDQYKTAGTVSIVGRDLVFRRPDWFMRAVELANNFEVFPKTDGTVQISFTFYGLTVPVEE